MVSRKFVEQRFRELLQEINNPNIDIIPCKTWDRICKKFELSNEFSKKGVRGTAVEPFSFIVVRNNIKKIELDEVLWHEILHILFPDKPHWWIYSVSIRLSGTEHHCPFKSENEAYMWRIHCKRLTEMNFPERNALIQETKIAQRNRCCYYLFNHWFFMWENNLEIFLL